MAASSSTSEEFRVSTSGPSISQFMYDAVNRPTDFECLLLGDYQRCTQRELSDQHDAGDQNRPSTIIHDVHIRRIVPTGIKFSFYDRGFNLKIPDYVADIIKNLNGSSTRTNSMVRSGILGWMAFQKCPPRFPLHETYVCRAFAKPNAMSAWPKLSTTINNDGGSVDDITKYFPWPGNGCFYVFAHPGTSNPGVLDWSMQLNAFNTTTDQLRTVRLHIRNLGDTTHVDYWKLGEGGSAALNGVGSLLTGIVPDEITRALEMGTDQMAENAKRRLKEAFKETVAATKRAEEAYVQSRRRNAELGRPQEFSPTDYVKYGYTPSSSREIDNVLKNLHAMIGSKLKMTTMPVAAGGGVAAAIGGASMVSTAASSVNQSKEDMKMDTTITAENQQQNLTSPDLFENRGSMPPTASGGCRTESTGDDGGSIDSTFEIVNPGTIESEIDSDSPMNRSMNMTGDLRGVKRPKEATSSSSSSGGNSEDMIHHHLLNAAIHDEVKSGIADGGAPTSEAASSAHSSTSIEHRQDISSSGNHSSASSSSGRPQQQQRKKSKNMELSEYVHLHQQQPARSVGVMPSPSAAARQSPASSIASSTGTLTRPNTPSSIGSSRGSPSPVTAAAAGGMLPSKGRGHRHPSSGVAAQPLVPPGYNSQMHSTIPDAMAPVRPPSGAMMGVVPPPPGFEPRQQPPLRGVFSHGARPPRPQK